MALRVKVRRTRPRVYLSDDLLPEIRRRTETTHVDEWSELVVWSRGIAHTPEEHRLRPKRLADRAGRLAFLYAVRRDERDVPYALELAPRLAALPPSPEAVEAMARLYDSFRAVLPEKHERALAEAILAGAGRLYEERIRGAAVLAEARSEAIAPVLAAGIALYGEESALRNLLGAAVHAARDLTGTLQFFLEEDGGFPLGWAESLVHLGQMPKLALLAETGLGQAWPKDVPWLARYAEFLEAGIRPGARRSAGGSQSRSDPRWLDGGRARGRLGDLRRVLAYVASESANPAALRLLAGLRVPGRQDEKILYERRPLAECAEDAGRPAPALFYRRAALAVFRGAAVSADGRKSVPQRSALDDGIECVVRCAGGGLAGGDERHAGSFSVACGVELVPGGASVANAIVATPAGEGPASQGAPAPRSFPRTRREINAPEFRPCEVIAFESAVGGGGDSVRGGFDYLVADLGRAHAPAALSATRTFVFLRGEAFGRPVLVVSDAVVLATPGAQTASVVHFAGRIEVSEARADLVREGVRLSDRVILPAHPRLWLDEPLGGETPPVPPDRQAGAGACERPFRLRIAPGESRQAVRFCQAFFVSPSDAPDEAACGELAAEGAVVLDIAGTALVLGVRDAARVECVSSGGLRGVAAIGLLPAAKLMLEVAGEPPVETATTDLGAAYVDAPIPAATGFVVSCERTERRI